MTRRYYLYAAAFLLFIMMIIGIPKLVIAEDIYLPALLNGQEQSGSAQTLDTRPTPTATPSRFGPSVPTMPLSTPQPRETIDLAPHLPNEEKALIIFRNEEGTYINYLVAPAEIRAQVLKLSEELGPESLQTIHYPEELYPWLDDEENAPPVATADPSFVHPEVPMPPTPKPRPVQ